MATPSARCAITMGAGGYREHDMLMVVAEGVENITGFPIGPDHNIVRG